MASTMKKSQSDDGLCLNKVPQPDAEKVFSTGLVVPILAVGAFVVFLQKMSAEFKAEAEVMPYSDPFKRIWWSAPAFFTVAYLIMITVGPRLMKNREPFQIKPYIFVYNSYQCLFNVWTVYAMYHEVFQNPWFKGIWGNTPQPDSNGFRIAFLVWVHYNNKFVELLDTVWMILRKKDEQVSFLHCYHHILLIWAWFFVCKVEAGGDCYFGASVNSFIHVIMYGYYTLALLNVSCPWKRWITNCQMLQFCLCLTHSIYVVIKGNMPIELPLAQGFVMVNMLVLFGQFYKKSYMNKGKGSKGGDKSATAAPAASKEESKKAL